MRMRSETATVGGGIGVVLVERVLDWLAWEAPLAVTIVVAVVGVLLIVSAIVSFFASPVSSSKNKAVGDLADIALEMEVLRASVRSRDGQLRSISVYIDLAGRNRGGHDRTISNVLLEVRRPLTPAFLNRKVRRFARWLPSRLLDDPLTPVMTSLGLERTAPVDWVLKAEDSRADRLQVLFASFGEDQRGDPGAISAWVIVEEGGADRRTRFRLPASAIRYELAEQLESDTPAGPPSLAP